MREALSTHSVDPLSPSSAPEVLRQICMRRVNSDGVAVDGMTLPDLVRAVAPNLDSFSVAGAASDARGQIAFAARVPTLPIGSFAHPQNRLDWTGSDALRMASAKQPIQSHPGGMMPDVGLLAPSSGMSLATRTRLLEGLFGSMESRQRYPQTEWFGTGDVPASMRPGGLGSGATISAQLAPPVQDFRPHFDQTRYLSGLVASVSFNPHSQRHGIGGHDIYTAWQAHARRVNVDLGWTYAAKAAGDFLWLGLSEFVPHSSDVMSGYDFATDNSLHGRMAIAGDFLKGKLLDKIPYAGLAASAGSIVGENWRAWEHAVQEQLGQVFVQSRSFEFSASFKNDYFDYRMRGSTFLHQEIQPGSSIPGCPDALLSFSISQQSTTRWEVHTTFDSYIPEHLQQHQRTPQVQTPIWDPIRVPDSHHSARDWALEQGGGLSICDEINQNRNGFSFDSHGFSFDSPGNHTVQFTDQSTAGADLDIVDP